MEKLEEFIKENSNHLIDFVQTDEKFEGCAAIPFNVYNRLIRIYYSSEN